MICLQVSPAHQKVEKPDIVPTVIQSTSTSTPPPIPSIGLVPKKPSEAVHSINKQKKIAWVESQIKKDQHEAVNPNYKTPFRSQEDACKRLLRYHVFDELDTSPWDLEKSDDNFEIKSAIAICRY